MTKNEMMHQIMAFDFSMIDLALYLDTHPWDKEAIEMFNDYKKECDMLKKKYTEEAGPITPGTTSPDNWNWLSDPWPWERMFN